MSGASVVECAVCKDDIAPGTPMDPARCSHCVVFMADCPLFQSDLAAVRSDHATVAVTLRLADCPLFKYDLAAVHI